jgi:hypothetical protein
LAVLATSLHLVSPGALDASSGLLRDEKLLIDLDFMSRSLAGELMYYLPKVEGVENRKCRVSWTFKKSGKDGECGFVDCSEQRKREELSKLDRAGIASRYSCRYAEYSTLSEPAWVTVRRGMPSQIGVKQIIVFTCSEHSSCIHVLDRAGFEMIGARR